MGSYLGRDALTGLSIEEGEAVVAIPIKYEGASYDLRTEIDQGWRIAGLPVHTKYDGYGETEALEAERIEGDSCHMFMVHESLFAHLVEEGLRKFGPPQWHPMYAKFKYAGTVKAIADVLLRDSPVSSRVLFDQMGHFSYLNNWYSPFTMPDTSLEEREDVEAMVELYLFVTGALFSGFSAMAPSYPDGRQESTKEIILAYELVEWYKRQAEREIDGGYTGDTGAMCSILARKFSMIEKRH